MLANFSVEDEDDEEADDSDCSNEDDDSDEKNKAVGGLALVVFEAALVTLAELLRLIAFIGADEDG